MKKSIVFTAFLFVVLISPILIVKAQENQKSTAESLRGQTPAPQFEQDNDQAPLRRPNLWRQLNLNSDQVQQIRLINQEMREDVRAAMIRYRQARRALDAAIYADALDQSEVEQRVRELTEAQTVALKIRTGIEFRIRQVLTPEQLTRFRALRQQFERELRQPMRWRSRTGASQIQPNKQTP